MGKGFAYATDVLENTDFGSLSDTKFEDSLSPVSAIFVPEFQSSSAFIHLSQMSMLT
jgi:hypothetical protein